MFWLVLVVRMQERNDHIFVKKLISIPKKDNRAVHVAVLGFCRVQDVGASDEDGATRVLHVFMLNHHRGIQTDRIHEWHY
jgi:hypothetical protein